MMTLIYNCKRCKVGRRVEYPLIQAPVSNAARRIYWRMDAGQRVPAGVWIESCGGGRPAVYGGDPLGLCPGCGKNMKYAALVAVTHAEIKCDARCTGARGHTCECSCGGKNHGARWAA